MTSVWIDFLLTSLIGTGLAFFLVFLKPITRKRFSGGWHYYMWLVVLVVMMVPIRIHLPKASVALSPATEDVMHATEQHIQTEVPQVTGVQEEVTFSEQTIITPKTTFFQPFKDFANRNLNRLAFIWLTVAISLFLFRVLSYMVFLAKMHRNSYEIPCLEIGDYTNKKVKTRVSETICSPLIVGVLKPTLLLPRTELTEEQLRNILAHEACHLNRNDIVYKWFLTLSKCVHWFNPAIYYIGKQVDTDCEISCDLQVVKNMDVQAEKNYVETILALLTQKYTKHHALTTGMTGHKKTLKKRFTMIRNKFSMNKTVTVISIVAAVVIFVVAWFASGVLNGFLSDKKEMTETEVATRFADVLLNDKVFFSADYRATMSLGAYCERWGRESDIKRVHFPRFTVLDMDADGAYEVLLGICVNDVTDYGVLVLKCMEDEVYGWSFSERQLGKVKKDGTFTQSGGAVDSAAARLRFDGKEWAYEKVPQLEQDAKQDVVWYAYTAENILAQLQGGAHVPKSTAGEEPRIVEALGLTLDFSAAYLQDIKQKEMDENHAEIHFYISVEGIPCKMYISKTTPISLEYDYEPSLEQPWESTANKPIPIQVQKSITDKVVSAKWEYKNYYFAIIGENVDFTYPNSAGISIPKTAIFFINQMQTDTEKADGNSVHADKTETHQIVNASLYQSENGNTPVSVTSFPEKVGEDDIGFMQTVWEKGTNIKNIESDLKKTGKKYTINRYSYKDNCNSTMSNITCDKNGNISLYFDINTENLVDITFKDSITKEEVAQFGILANDVNSYSFMGFDKNKTYDIIIQGATNDTWQIEGQYILY